MSNVKVWLITGASSGFGRAMTEHLLNIGNKVVATLRKPEALADLAARYSPTQLLVLKVDVTNAAEVAAAFSKAEQVFNRIDVVFNNAGVNFVAEVESTTEQDARALFEVNFWGAAHVTKETIRFFRDVNKPRGGRLIQVSSTMGVVGRPALGFYSASKFALEGVSESLATELDPEWNIKITIVEPGPFRTDIVGNNYRFRKTYGSTELFDGDVTKAVAVIEKLSRHEDAQMRFPLHKNTLMAMRDKGKSLLEGADTYESWNEDVYLDK